MSQRLKKQNENAKRFSKKGVILFSIKSDRRLDIPIKNKCDVDNFQALIYTDLYA